jgi:predicted kinase
MPYLQVMIGLPGSGKSTLARELIVKEGNTVRVNRDSLREMLYAPAQWTGKREGVVVAVERQAAIAALSEGYNVIVDDTNLSANKRVAWEQLAKSVGAQYREHDMKKTVDECIQWDRSRTIGSVGREVIENMALRNGLLPPIGDDKKIVIVDVDGTLADCEWRVKQFLEGEKKDWDGFFSVCNCDEPIDTVVRWVKKLVSELLIVIVSGRPMDKCGFMTRDWMRRPDVKILYHRMFMRPAGDKRSDVDVKNEILAHILKWVRKDQIGGVIDDRPRVVEEVWRAAGIRVFPVGMREGNW